MIRRMTVGTVATLLLGCLTLQSHGEQRDDLRDFMRAKLKHSQKVLEGLVLSDYEMIIKGSQEMSLLSLASNWQVLQTPEYIEYSRKFRSATEALSAAAGKQNLDESTAAYNRLTVRCVECHKYVRDVRMARVN
jgi:cytochrome c556